MKPTRQFNGVAGQKSVDNMGPEVLSADLDKIMKMFNPAAVHTDNSKGGIGLENLNFSFGDVGSDTTLSMAEQIGSKAIAGISGTTVWNQLFAIVAMVLDRYTKAESDTLTATATNTLVQTFDMNLTTGVITVTKKDGTVQTWDTPLEKVPATFEFVEVSGVYYIKVTNVDGTTSQTDVSALMNHYTFSSTDEIAFTESGTGTEKSVSATIRANSIGLDKLTLTAVSALEGYVSSAAQSASTATEKANSAIASANSAKSSKEESKISETNAMQSESAAKLSELKCFEKAFLCEQLEQLINRFAIESQSYAVGGTGTRADEDIDNAKYYYEKSKAVTGGDFVTIADFENAMTSVSEAMKFKQNKADPELKTKATQVIPAINEILTGLKQKSSASEFIAHFRSSLWVGSNAPYTQEVMVSGLLVSDIPIVDVLLTEDLVESETILKNYNEVYRIIADAGKITAYAKRKPTIDLSVQGVIIRNE
ncbi:MAG: hypothetical protein ACK5MV_00035 [Aminipila sp.]